MVEAQQGDGSEPQQDSTLIGPGHSCPPASIGRFRVVRLRGYGSFTQLYEVTTADASGQRLALKLLNTDHEPLCRWSERVAVITSGLKHPHILPCHESGRHQGRSYRVMPLVDGPSIHELFQRQAMPQLGQVVPILRSVASAVDYAHGRGVVHGDLHPKHVLLDRTGHVWLIGFAEVGGGFPEVIGAFCGNPHHLAPEQFASFENTVPQTDVYAMGEVAFLLLTGRFPFQGRVAFELIECKRAGPVPSIRDHRPDFPGSVDLTLQRAMAARPADRFRSAGEFVEELDAALRGRQQVTKRWWQLWR